MTGKTLAVIPARGGSVTLRRKNLLPDGNGIPLVLASARAARDAGCYVVVSTDDPEIESLARIDGHFVQTRGFELANVPVDEVVQVVVDSVAGDSPVTSTLLVQPTVQPITADILKYFLRIAEAGERPVALGVEDRHLIWAEYPDHVVEELGRSAVGYKLLTDRVERQACRAWPVREMGVRWWPAGASPSRDQPQAVIAAPHHLVDIDTAADYQQIRRQLRIGFLVWANKQIGTGHLRRALTLAEGLQHHDVTIGLTKDSDQWAFDLVEERGFSVAGRQEVGDVAVFDRLDSVASWKPPMEPFVVLEDMGYGARYATAVINAMYDFRGMYAGIPYTGAKYAVLRPEFLIGDYQVQLEATRVLVLFGGTDPSGLLEVARDALYPLPNISVSEVVPAAEVSVAAEMHDADLLITSGGRTVFEAAAVGIPTIVMCQNQRELTHTHLGVGNINLGLGRLVQPDQLRWHVEQLLGDYEVRRDMSATAKASIDGYGADRVRRIIEHVGLYGEAP